MDCWRAPSSLTREVIKWWMSSVDTCDKSSSVQAKIDGMTMSGLILITRRWIVLSTSGVGIAEDGDLGMDSITNH